MKGKITIKKLNNDGKVDYMEYSPIDFLKAYSYDDEDDGYDLDSIAFWMNNSDEKAFERVLDEMLTEYMEMVKVIERFLEYAEDGLNCNWYDEK